MGRDGKEEGKGRRGVGKGNGRVEGLSFYENKQKGDEEG